MTKNNFLLVDLNESQTKKLAETITSDTSRKILNHLTEKEDTEANIAKMLEIPISTVHYHLQKLQEAQLVIADEYHYSQKGREVNHYKLANKYIIIAPRKVSGLKEKLKGILPVGLIVLGISGIIKLLTLFSGRAYSNLAEVAPRTEMLKAVPMTADLSQETATTLEQEAVNSAMEVSRSSPDIALWFLIGSVVTIGIYVLILLIKEKLKK